MSLPSSTTASPKSRHARISVRFNMMLVCALALLLAPAAVLAEVQDDWTFPTKAGTKIAAGQKITIAWNNNLQTWFGSYCPGCSTLSANLYVTSVGISGQLPFRHKIASKIDVTSTTSLDWKVDIPEAEYTCQGCSNWAFKFDTEGGGSQVTSGTFTITGGSPELVGGSPSSSAPPGSTTTATVIVSSNAPAQTSAPVPTNAPATGNTDNNNNNNNNQNNSDGGLTTGAKAGTAIGAIIGAIFMVALGFFLSQWNKRRNVAAHGTHIESGSMISSSGGRTKSNLGPRHRNLSDFMTDKPKDGNGMAEWDPKNTFHPSAPTVTTTISVRTNESVPDFLGLPPHTPDNASFELLPRYGSRG